MRDVKRYLGFALQAKTSFAAQDCVGCWPSMSTPGRIRTYGRRIRNPMLYPAELRERVIGISLACWPAMVKDGAVGR